MGNAQDFQACIQSILHGLYPCAAQAAAQASASSSGGIASASASAFASAIAQVGVDSLFWNPLSEEKCYSRHYLHSCTDQV